MVSQDEKLKMVLESLQVPRQVAATISGISAILIICTGGAGRPLRDRYFSFASVTMASLSETSHRLSLRCFSMALQASSAPAEVLKGEPLILTAPLLWLCTADRGA